MQAPCNHVEARRPSATRTSSPATASSSPGMNALRGARTRASHKVDQDRSFPVEEAKRKTKYKKWCAKKKSRAKEAKLRVKAGRADKGDDGKIEGEAKMAKEEVEVDEEEVEDEEFDIDIFGDEETRRKYEVYFRG
ncbi:hypothetical protein ACN47E_007935 [Coniothyrium glycines]